MVGSFEIFRKYQRSLLAIVAILAMLAFFVLPPFLQMGSQGGGQDPVAVSWKGGEFSEGGLERAVATRRVVNLFLAEAAALGGRRPARQFLPEQEEQVVQTMLLSQDARDNGVLVSDRAVNDFLAQWTGNLVRPEQLDDLLSRMRVGPLAVSQQDVFDVLRTELAAQTILMLHQPAFGGTPPGWRWEQYRRLDQQAKVELVPVVVETFADQVPPPTEAALRSLYEKHKNALPEARSSTPGFREPHRVQYAYLVAKRGVFDEEAAKEVTDEQIAEYYEKNKVSMFRAQPATEKAAGDASATTDKAEPATDKPATDKPATDKPATDKPAADKPAADKPAADKPAADKPAADKPAADKPAAGSDAGASSTGPRATLVAFKQPAGDKPAADKSVSEKPAPEKPAADKPADGNAAEQPKAADVAEKATPAAEDPSQFEPLEKVKDEIRRRLAQQRADTRIDAIFTKVAGDLGSYAEDFALWQARRPSGVEPPRPPDLEKIAEKQGLGWSRSELVSADAAVAAGGIGSSFERFSDPTNPFGFRAWLDQMYGSNTMTLRPITSRDVEGNRYLSWKTEDQPEFTPSFATARADVERAWRILEARGLAKRRAEEITRQAAATGQPLASTVQELSKDDARGGGLQATEVGPFSWFAQDAVAAGGPPRMSEPEGVSMAGEEFMRAVFSLEPGGTAVAFNEPQTVCYAIRLVAQDPAPEQLREQFVTARGDRQRTAMLEQGEMSRSFQATIEEMEKRRGLEWKRQPRGFDR